MRILCTFPGKHGDLLWALPTMRAIAEYFGEAVHLLVSPKYAGIVPLVQRQPYINSAAEWPHWQVQDTAPMTPWSPFEETLHHQALGTGPEGFDHVFHLGYRVWPTKPLPFYVQNILAQEYSVDLPIDLTKPWITAPYPLPHSDACLGFSDEHFELKYGVRALLRNRFVFPGAGNVRMVDLSTSPRWTKEGGVSGFDWNAAASWLATTKVFVGCCSALHVLACAMGVPVVMMEPIDQRHNDIFYPYGKNGPQVHLVLGGDGRPTFDARHTAEAVEAVWARLTENANQ